MVLKERVCSKRLFLIMMKDVTATGARGAEGLRSRSEPRPPMAVSVAVGWVTSHNGCGVRAGTKRTPRGKTPGSSQRVVCDYQGEKLKFRLRCVFQAAICA